MVGGLQQWYRARRPRSSSRGAPTGPQMNTTNHARNIPGQDSIAAKQSVLHLCKGNLPGSGIDKRIKAALRARPEIGTTVESHGCGPTSASRAAKLPTKRPYSKA